jgi:translocator protein
VVIDDMATPIAGWVLLVHCGKSGGNIFGVEALSNMTYPAHRNHARSTSLLSVAVFFVAVVGIGLLVGFLTRPGEWYDGLVKPPFNPPSWVFGPVWTILYVLIALAGWRIWRAAPRSRAMMLWIAQMVLNWLWSPTFFGAEAPWFAFAVIIALLAVIIAFMGSAWRHDRLAVLLFAPYASWVAFATVLNGSIAVMN